MRFLTAVNNVPRHPDRVFFVKTLPSIGTTRSPAARLCLEEPFYDATVCPVCKNRIDNQADDNCAASSSLHLVYQRFAATRLHTVTLGDNQIAQIVVNEIYHTVLVMLQRRNQCARNSGNVKHRVITSCKPPLACRGATANEIKVATYYGTDPLPHINPTSHDDSPSIGVSVGSPHQAAADVKNVPPLRFAPV